MAKRVLILATDGFDGTELGEVKKALEIAGIETVIASPVGQTIRSWHNGDWGPGQPSDVVLDDVDEEDFEGLFIPGGPFSPDSLRLDDRAVELVEDFDASGKPVAAIGKGPWLLVEADVVGGRTVTGWPSLHTDLENAGGDVVDRAVAIDDNLITSRQAKDAAALAHALIEALIEREDLEDEEEDEETEDTAH